MKIKYYEKNLIVYFENDCEKSYIKDLFNNLHIENPSWLKNKELDESSLNLEFYALNKED